MTLWRKIFTYFVRPFGDRFAERECNLNNKRLPSNSPKVVQVSHCAKSKSVSEAISESHPQEEECNNDESECTPNQMREIIAESKNYRKFYQHSNKYCEELWKSVTMAFVVIFGICAIYGKEFFHNPQIMFLKYPQSEPIEHTWFYRIAMGYHGHRAIFQFLDHKRKDFWVCVLCA